MDRMPWIVATGQAWKLRLFYGLVLLGQALFVRFTLSYNGIEVASTLGNPKNPALFLGAFASSLLWLLVSIQCPSCDALPVWTVLREAPASRWLIELSRSDRCAVCGSRGLPGRG
jgi:hypothetical protein